MHILKLCPLFFFLPLVASGNLPQRETLKREQRHPTVQKEAQRESKKKYVHPRKLFTIECISHLGAFVMYWIVVALITTYQVYKESQSFKKEYERCRKDNPFFCRSNYEAIDLLQRFFDGLYITYPILGGVCLLLPSLFALYHYKVMQSKSPKKLKNSPPLFKKYRYLDPILMGVTLFLGFCIELVGIKRIEEEKKSTLQYIDASLRFTLVFSVPLLYPIFSVIVKSILYKKNLQNLPMSPLPKKEGNASQKDKKV